VDAARISEQSAEQIKLSAGELHLAAACRAASRVEVEVELPGAQNGLLGLEAAGAAQPRASGP
jgi:hypothetical protein